MSTRKLIVNADDLGLSSGVNGGIIDAHRSGIVTSASLMVRWPAAVDAVALARRNPELAIGLHIDLGEWYYDEGTWPSRYDVVDLADPDAVQCEVERQLDHFVRLVGRAPTHLDSHQHVHRDPAIGRIVDAIGRRLGVPVRSSTPGIAYCGSFYGQDGRGFPVPDAITAEALVDIVASLDEGVTEVACHAGYGHGLETTYAEERALEVAALCDPRVRATIDTSGVELISFADLAMG